MVRLKADPTDVTRGTQATLFFGRIRLHFLGGVRLRPDLPISQDERRPGENALANRVESLRCAWQQLLEPLQLQAIDRITRLRLDERQRNHPVEEEVIRVGAGGGRGRR